MITQMVECLRLDLQRFKIFSGGPPPSEHASERLRSTNRKSRVICTGKRNSYISTKYVAKLFGEKVRMILLVFPGNP